MQLIFFLFENFNEHLKMKQKVGSNMKIQQKRTQVKDILLHFLFSILILRNLTSRLTHEQQICKGGGSRPRECVTKLGLPMFSWPYAI